MGIIKYFNYVDGELFIFDHFVINQIKEGVVIEPSHNDLLNEIIQQNYKGKNMIYISNRVKSYSVNPLVYPEAEKIPNLIAIGIMPKTRVMRKSAEYERQFYDKPYEIFDKLSDAFQWANGLIEKDQAVDNSN